MGTDAWWQRGGGLDAQVVRGKLAGIADAVRGPGRMRHAAIQE
jgi:hypothetical protein